MDYRDIAPEEIAALQAFANAHRLKKDRSPGCSNWKDELSMIYWYNARIWRHGPVEDMGTILHGIRNDLGPTWLYDVCDIKPEAA